MMLDLLKIFLPTLTAFSLGVLITPFLTNILYTKKAWKKKAGKTAYNGQEASEFNRLHKDKEVGTPRLGGMVIWSSAFLTILSIWLLAQLWPTETTAKLVFLSRDQTWIPLAALLLGGLIGFIDDVLEISQSNGGISLRYRLLMVGCLGLAAGWWFFAKLGVDSLGLPAQWGGDLHLGWLIVPAFALVTMAIYSGGIIDGLDGLAGGVLASIFASYAIIAFFLNQIDLAAFSAMIVGAILAFLWFNIPPARFYISETGSMALTLTLAVVAFMSDSLGGGYGVIVLPIIAFPLVITSGSVILQLSWRKIFGRKLFKIAPLHHHFEAVGWPSYKVVMRFWIISVVMALLGAIMAIVGL